MGRQQDPANSTGNEEVTMAKNESDEGIVYFILLKMFCRIKDAKIH